MKAKKKQTAAKVREIPQLGDALDFEEFHVVDIKGPLYSPVSTVIGSTDELFNAIRDKSKRALSKPVVKNAESLTYEGYRTAYERTLAEAEQELERQGQSIEALDDLLEWLDKSISDCRTGIYESEVFGYEAFQHHRHERLRDALAGPNHSIRPHFVVAIEKNEMGAFVYYDSVDLRAYFVKCQEIKDRLCEYLKERATQSMTHSQASVKLWLEAVDKIEHLMNDWEATAEEAARLGRIDYARAALAAVTASQATAPAPTAQPPADPTTSTAKKPGKRGRPKGSLQAKKRVKAAVAIVERATANAQLNLTGVAHECRENAGRDGLPTAREADYLYFDCGDDGKSYERMKVWARRNGTTFTELITLAESKPQEWEERKKTLI